MKPKYIIGLVVIVGFVVYAASSFTSSITPYVSIEEARTTDQTVQVKGQRVDTGNFDLEKNMFTFRLKDEAGKTINVIYDGPKPGNFDQATEIVCIGNFKEGEFHAKNILVKCPSKYQEEGAKV